MKFVTGFLILGVLASACVFGDTYYVDDDDNIQGDAGLLDIIIYPSIQAAIDDSNDGDTIIIMPGLYTGVGNRNLNFNGKAITVRGLDPNDSNVVEATIIDCNGSSDENHRGFYFHNGEDLNSVICGLTIVNGYISGFGRGGGIRCQNSNPLISRCVIRDSEAKYGAGICCSYNDSVIEYCVIANNTGTGIFCEGDDYTANNTIIENCIVSNNSGTGISCEDCDTAILGCKVDNNCDRGIYCDNGIIEGCIISRNSCGSSGGGIYSQNLKIKDCIVVGNKTQNYGGGIFCNNFSQIINCTIVANITVEDNKVGGLCDFGGSRLLSNILWSNKSGDNYYQLNCAAQYSCIQDEDPNVHVGPGNIDDYPEFVREPNDGGDGFGDDPDTPGIDEGANDDLGDLHLMKNSPCINAGLPNYIAGIDDLDIDGQPRVIAGRVDMGVDEYAPMIAVLVPQGGEVWAADSNHTIVWASYDIGQNVDIQFSDNNGVDWDVVADDVNNDGSFLLNLPNALDSNQCVIEVVPTTPDANVICIPSGLFTIQPYNPDEPVDSLWQTLGKDYLRRGLSDFNGPQLGCVKWAFDTNGPVTTGVAAGDEGQIYAACEDGNLYAIDVNGNLLWKYDANTPFLSTPSIGPDGTVYVGGENGTLYAIDKNGALKWTHFTGAYVSASPAVSSDGKIFAASQDGKLYALAPDGSELWEFETAGYGINTKGAILGSPAIDSNGIVYVAGFYDPNLYALDADDGSIVWVCNLKNSGYGQRYGWSVASPVVGLDGTIYHVMQYDPNLYAIDPNTGQINWALNLADPCSEWFGKEFSEEAELVSGSFYRLGNWYQSFCLSEPVIGPDGTIYVSFDDPFLRAVDPNGTIKWISRLGMVGGFTMAVGDDGLVYAACDDGHLYVADSDGTELSRFETGGRISYPVIANEGNLVVSDSNNKIWAIGTSNCEQQALALHRPADMDADGVINFKDFAVVALQWLQCTDKYYGGRMDGEKDEHCDFSGQEIYFISDVNRDLYIDIEDLKEISVEWLSE